MKKEPVVLALAILFAAVAVTALARQHRLRLVNMSLQDQLAALADQPDPTPPPPPPPPPPPDPALTREARLKLEAEINGLRRLLAERDLQIAALNTAVAAAREPREEEEPRENRRRRWEEMADEFRANNPERAAEIEEQRANFRERLKTAANDQLAFFEAVDTAEWAAEDQETHQKLLDLIDTLSGALLGDRPPNLADDEARANLFTQMREAGELLERERTLLLHDAARQMGYDAEGAAEFVAYMETINRVTSPRGFMPAMGGRGGRGR